MRKTDSYRGTIYVIGFVVILSFFLSGCNGHVAGKKSYPDMETTTNGNNSGFHPGDLVVGWGEKRKESLNIKMLYEDLEKNGVPGGGEPDDVVMITFQKKDGTAFVADLHGNEIEPCAEVVNGKLTAIKEGCQNLTNTDFLGVSSYIINTHKSPDCPVGIWGNYAAQRPCN